MKKHFMQLGRSMVEMLGVLAIVGLLSIIGLYGYRKAMLQIKANDMWDALYKFEAAVEEYRLLHPEETRAFSSAPSAESVSGMYSAPTDANAVFLNRSDLIPAWAEGDPKKFMLLFSNNGGVLAIRHIMISNLCSTFLPQGEPTSSSVWFWEDPDTNIRYECRIGNTKTVVR